MLWAYLDLEVQRMKMHLTRATPQMLSALSSLNCWDISPAEIGKLAALVIGNAHMPQLRHGTMSAIIVGTTYGGAARRFGDEFRLLAQQCVAIRTDTAESELTAIMFFHLRFGGIHPLVDSNGRVGRLLLSEQIRRKFAIQIQTTLDFLHASQTDYRAAFAPDMPREKFELMGKLLARLVGVQIDTSREIAFAIAPAYPDKRPLLASMKHDGGARSSDTENHLFRKRAINIELQRALKVTR